MKCETSDRKDPREDNDEEEQQNLISMFKRIHKFQTNTEIEIRVYQGAVSYGNQWIPFHQALSTIRSTSTIRIVSLDCREVNDNKLSEMDMINWLHQGDIHFIISHIHQGIINVNMNKLYTSIMKLHDHPGFPAGNNLQCPVFTQDKYKYLSVLMSKGLCNATLKVDFLPTMDYAALKLELQSYVIISYRHYCYCVYITLSHFYVDSLKKTMKDVAG